MNRTVPSAPRTARVAAIGVAALLAALGCASLRESRTNWPVKEYEKIIAGRLDADYVGDAACTAKCHAHDAIARDFRLSVHGEQVSVETGQPLVNCESCHGPGSLAVANIKDERCDSSTFIDLEKIPAGAQSLICLKCHGGQSTEGIAGWAGSRHAFAGVSCTDCHKLHQGPGQKVARREIAPLCTSCHREIAAQFALPSHHPVPEGIVTCVDCHEPHGTINDANLRSAPVRNVCARCHADKAGPFVFEHVDVNADCQTCHDPHGSANSDLTRWAQPFLCLQCHQGHNTPRHPGLAEDAKRVLFGDCTACHTRIHGTDLPGYRKDDRFTR